MDAEATRLLFSAIVIAYFRYTTGLTQNLTTEKLGTQDAQNVSVLPEIGRTVNGSLEQKLLCTVNSGTFIHCERAIATVYLRYIAGLIQNLTTLKAGTQGAQNVSVLPEIGRTVNGSLDEKLLCIDNGTVVDCERAFVSAIAYFPYTVGLTQYLPTPKAGTQGAQNVSVLPEIGRTVNGSLEEKLLCIVNGTVTHCKRASQVKDVFDRETFPEKLLALEKDESEPGVDGHFMLCTRKLDNYSSPISTLVDVNYTNFTCSTVYPTGTNNVSKHITRVRRDYDYGENESQHEIFFKRDTSTSCSVPKGLKSVEIRCKETPDSVVCKSFCIYGYTLDEGIESIHKCLYTENVWSAPFEECISFVNCSVMLVAPGTLSCGGNTRHKSLSCIVGCEMNEDNDAVEEQTHFCNNDGTWEPPMPFCVAPRGEIPVARKTDVVEHSDTDYP